MPLNTELNLLTLGGFISGFHGMWHIFPPTQPTATTPGFLFSFVLLSIRVAATGNYLAYMCLDAASVLFMR
jgi:hypothetical protein